MPKIDPKPWRDHAARLAQMGLYVVPVVPRTKCPMFPGWVQCATRDRAQIRQWATEYPNANVGVVLREHLVVDVDDQAEFDAWLDGRALPRTMSVLTGRGRHHYYTLPGLAEGLRTARVPGADLKVSGLVVGPGSIHPTGETYRLSSARAMCEAPDWLIEQVVPEPTPGAEPRRDREQRWGQAWPVDRQLRVVSVVWGASEGERNAKTFWCFCEVFRSGLVNADLERFQFRVWEAALAKGLEPDEIATCERSAAATVARRARGVA